MATNESIYAGATGTGLTPFLPSLSQDTTAKSSILGVLILFTVLYYFVPYGLSPLNRYPGPLLEALSNYWRMYHAARGSMHLKIKSLHDKYGPVVRTAPNQIDLDCPSLIRTCFERQGRFQKPLPPKRLATSALSGTPLVSKSAPTIKVRRAGVRIRMRRA